jgi:hypothetical protein
VRAVPARTALTLRVGSGVYPTASNLARIDSRPVRAAWVSLCMKDEPTAISALGSSLVGPNVPMRRHYLRAESGEYGFRDLDRVESGTEVLDEVFDGFDPD